MLSDEQLVGQLRSELAPLEPRADLAERVREQARTAAWPLGPVRRRDRSGRFPLVAVLGAITAGFALAAAVFALAGHNATPRPAIHPAGQSHALKTQTNPRRHTGLTAQHAQGSALPRARAGRGPVTCSAGSCRQRGHVVRNPSGSGCGRYMTWVAKTTAPPATTYGCARNAPIAGY